MISSLKAVGTDGMVLTVSRTTQVGVAAMYGCGLSKPKSIIFVSI